MRVARITRRIKEEEQMYNKKNRKKKQQEQEEARRPIRRRRNKDLGEAREEEQRKKLQPTYCSPLNCKAWQSFGQPRTSPGALVDTSAVAGFCAAIVSSGRRPFEWSSDPVQPTQWIAGAKAQPLWELAVDILPTIADS